MPCGHDKQSLPLDTTIPNSGVFEASLTLALSCPQGIYDESSKRTFLKDELLVVMLNRPTNRKSVRRNKSSL